MNEPSRWTRASQYCWIAISLVLVAVAAGVVAAGPGQGKGATAPSAQPATASGGKTANTNRPIGDKSNDVAGSGAMEPIVARVNNQIVTYKTLADECIGRKGTEVLEAMISKLLILQACKASGITVSAQEIDQEVTRHAAQLKISRDDYFKLVQEQLGLSPERYQEDKLWSALALKKLAAPSVRITHQDIEHGFEALYGEKVQCRWIVLENLQHAMRIWNELRDSSKEANGKCELAEFERQVGKCSSDIATRSIGGKIQPIAHHVGPAFQELEAAAFAMKEDGEISKVVQLGNSYVILYREGRVPPTSDRLEDKRAEIQEKIYAVMLEEQMGRVFQELQEKATIENLLTGDVSTPVRDTTTSSEKSSKTKPEPTKVGSSKESPQKAPSNTRK